MSKKLPFPWWLKHANRVVICSIDCGWPLDLPNDPEAFAQAAPQCPVFRLDYSGTESPFLEQGCIE